MRILTLAAALTASLSLLAEHLPGGSIAVRCIGGTQYEVTLRLWRECTGAAMIPQSLGFMNTCGVTFTLDNLPLVSVANVSPVCPDEMGQTTCEGGPVLGIEEYTYRTNVYLSPCNHWRIYWNTCCRLGSLNMQGSQGIYIEALLNNLGSPCVILPTFADPTPPVVCVNQPVSYDPGVLFEQGQTLRFRLMDARRLLNADPLNLDIQPVIYQPPFNGEAPYTGLAIDSLTGQITFTPDLQGYIVCVIAVDVRDANGVWRGTVMRDFPFIARACTNQVPDPASGTVENLAGLGAATGPYAVQACGELCFEAAISDPDAAQSLTLTSNLATAIPGAFFSVAGSNPAVATICLPESVPHGTYLFTITAVDDACPVRGSQTYTYVVTRSASDVDAGADAEAMLCPGASVDLSELLTGDAGGQWSEGPVVSAPGVYTYSVAGACGVDEALFTVVEGALPDAGEDATAEGCEGIPIDLGALVSGEPGGTWSAGPVVEEAGTYTYTVTNACGSSAAEFTVSFVPPPSAGGSRHIAVCPQAQPFFMADSLSGTVDPGGAWFLGGEPADALFDPSVSPAGDYCYVVSNEACGDATACLAIVLLDPAEPHCITLGVGERPSPLRLHPNPSNGLLRIEAPGAVRADVVDASGRSIWETALRDGSGAFQLPASLANGSYALRAWRADGSMQAQRFELAR